MVDEAELDGAVSDLPEAFVVLDQRDGLAGVPIRSCSASTGGISAARPADAASRTGPATAPRSANRVLIALSPQESTRRRSGRAGSYR